MNLRYIKEKQKIEHKRNILRLTLNTKIFHRTLVKVNALFMFFMKFSNNQLNSKLILESNPKVNDLVLAPDRILVNYKKR